MARKVKETPVLSGKDAASFSRVIKENEAKKVSSSEYSRAQTTYKSIKLISRS